MKPIPASTDLPVILFEQKSDWEAWLDINHIESAGIWLRIAKKTSGIQSISYDEALEVALCYGWIDGQKKTYDETSWLQKFTPRKAKSIWSKINKEKAQQLIEHGQMKPAGLKAVESAKQDGRWEAAYDSFGKAEIPDDFQSELDKNAKAKAFYATLNQQNKYAILFRIQTAKKAETRKKRIMQFIDMLEKNKKLYL
jgi:uncharacterized protein YdeI (YjbR/CyaY-like superfamily)